MFLSPLWPRSEYPIRPSASWAVDSEFGLEEYLLSRQINAAHGFHLNSRVLVNSFQQIIDLPKYTSHVVMRFLKVREECSGVSFCIFSL